MKIKKSGDGKLWVFDESIGPGWFLITSDFLNVAEIDAGEILTELIKVKMEEKKDLSYSAAFSEVQSENLDLARKYLEQVRRRR